MTLSKQKIKDFIAVEQSWIFTFGSSHGYANCYIKIWGTINTARDEMIRLFDSRWAFQYSSEEAAGVKR